MERRKGNMRRFVICILAALFLCIGSVSSFPVLAKQEDEHTDSGKEETVVLRVCSWEEYIDLGDWEEDERIELDNGETILGINPMVTDFEEWYYETYGIRVQVQYSCFGTNEDLYNMLTLGDTYDLVCPSDYMIMKLMMEGSLIPYSEEFYDTENAYNYYINGVSPYIKKAFEENRINGESWSKYAAGYMWGVTGILYNPEEVTRTEAQSWEILNNPRFAKQVTMKDNVRDSYFAALGILRKDQLLDQEFIASENYHQGLSSIMNDVSPEAVADVQDILQDIKDNVYSFETDSGKADMISGKVLANYQWSGDAVYAMDQAEEEDFYLNFSVPQECTNLWFDGWVMLKDGIGTDAAKQHAAEAFVNFLSRPDNVVRNMYYIGYTSVISGGEDDTVYEYANWCYSAGDEDTETVEYPLGYFFSGDNEDERYIMTAPVDQTERQLFAQYPSEDVIRRSAIMQYFDDDVNARINQMWINVRCYNIKDVPIEIWIFAGILLIGVAGTVAAGKLRSY